jgi:uncharacterized protein (TIGR00251 family)
MTDKAIQQVDDGVVFKVKVVPGSSKTAICGWLDTMIKVKVATAPEKGKANECLLEFLAKQLDVKRRAVGIISGHTSSTKQLHVAAISAETLLKKLNLDEPRS